MTTSITNTQACRVLVGAPGCGKTTRMLREMAEQPGRYVLAAPRQDLLEEHTARLQGFAAQSGTTPTLQTIHSRQGARERVGRRVTEALAAPHADAHVVVAITHEALLSLDGAMLADWHVRIDEIPDAAVRSGQVRIGASWPALAAYYALEPSGEPGRSIIHPRSDVAAPPLAAIIADVGQDLVALHRAIANPSRAVMIDIAAWEDAALAGRSVGWSSIWSMDAVAGCQSLVLGGASFVGSLLERVTQRSQRLTVTVEEVATAVRSSTPNIGIHYFTRHLGSTTWWQTDEGSRCLVQISRHLEGIGFAGFWSSNEGIVPYFRHRFPAATACAPKQAGSNSLRQHTACAMIYSAKAQAGDTPILDALDLDRNDIQSAREDEDVFQFALRGAIRDADYDGAYDIYLYDQDQAERLRDRMAAQGYADITLSPVAAAGIMDVARPQSPRGPEAAASQTSVAELREQGRQKERERGQRRRTIAKEQSRAEGTLRTPGRPKGARSLSPQSS